MFEEYAVAPTVNLGIPCNVQTREVFEEYAVAPAVNLGMPCNVQTRERNV
jgi:hypothetical protein